MAKIPLSERFSQSHVVHTDYESVAVPIGGSVGGSGVANTHISGYESPIGSGMSVQGPSQFRTINIGGSGSYNNVNNSNTNHTNKELRYP